MVFGLPLQLYGLILSFAMIVGWWLVVTKAKQGKYAADDLETAAFYALVAGIVGARVWHVLTDWSLYHSALIDVFKIWQGGLSIFGAVLGGIGGLWLWKKTQTSTLSIPHVLDLSMFGLPIAQAIGRWGNYFNQELYGFPTTLPWGIYIEPSHRLAEFMSAERFHPLFLYEAMLTLAFGIWLWWFEARGSHPFFSIGTGNYSWLYILYYSLIRFFLDFLRPDKNLLFTTGLGLNQAIVLAIMVVAGYTLLQTWKSDHRP